MLGTPEIVETVAEDAAVIRLTVPRDEMKAVFGPAIGEVMASLAAQDIAPAGPVFAHHLRMSPDWFDVELGVAVSSPVTASGRVTPGELPAAKLARVVYSGPYDGLPAAWGAFGAWIRATGHRQADHLWEVYAAGPQSSPDPADWRTELNWPLAE